MTTKPILARLLSEYGLIPVLAILAGYFSVATLTEQRADGAPGGEVLARDILARFGPGARVCIVAGPGHDDLEFTRAIDSEARRLGLTITDKAQGHPHEARDLFSRLSKEASSIQAIAASRSASRWTLVEKMAERYPSLANVPVMTPRATLWPNFLKKENLLNIANQISVIAIIAIGMTAVIISGGIDLSVGSLVAVSAVLATWLIRSFGGEGASTATMIVACLVAIVACAIIGTGSGALITFAHLPPFLVTLATMLIASGLAYLLAQGQSVYQVPDRFTWLGRSITFGIPTTVLLMAVLYVVAHFVMSRTVPGRFLYAVGGNPEAARLCGVPVRTVTMSAYTISGALAGLGGVILASQLKSGSPTYGQMYELYVIAAVVVGGTSLSGGEGKMLGTLLGALLIAVIQNGMNLTGVESYTQKVVLGAVIVGAILLDQLKRRLMRSQVATA